MLFRSWKTVSLIGFLLLLQSMAYANDSFTSTQKAKISKTEKRPSPTPEAEADPYFNHFNASILGGAAFFLGHSSSGHGPNVPQGIYKASAAYLFKNHFEIGAEFGMTGNNPTLGLDLNYFITHHLFIGAALAYKITNHKNFVYVGGKVGYDFPILHKFAVGPEVIYLYNVTGHIEMLETLGAFKYFF